MNDGKIERSHGRCLGRQQLLANSMEISFQKKQKMTRRGQKFKKH